MKRIETKIELSVYLKYLFTFFFVTQKFFTPDILDECISDT